MSINPFLIFFATIAIVGLLGIAIIGVSYVYGQAGGGLYLANEVFVEGTTLNYFWYALNTGKLIHSDNVITSFIQHDFSNFQSNYCTLEVNKVTCVIPVSLGLGQRYPINNSDYILWTIDVTGSTTSPTSYANIARLCSNLGCQLDNSIATVAQQVPKPTPEPEPPVFVPEPSLYIVTTSASNPDGSLNEVGDTFDVIYRIENTGNVPLRFAQIETVIQDGFTDFTINHPDCTRTGQKVLCNVTDPLGVGQSWPNTIDGVVRLTFQIPSEVAGQTFVNTGIVHAQYGTTLYYADDSTFEKIEPLVIPPQNIEITVEDGIGLSDSVTAIVTIPEHTHDLINQRLDDLESRTSVLEELYNLLKNFFGI